MNQRGFATLEVILMIVVIGILATVAIPRFTDTVVKANTAKVQSDLSTLDNAIAIYYMEKGTYPTNLSDLSDYVKDVNNLEPPTGRVYVNGDEKEIASGTSYSIAQPTGESEKRAVLQVDGTQRTAGAFSTKKRTTSSSGSTENSSAGN